MEVFQHLVVYKLLNEQCFGKFCTNSVINLKDKEVIALWVWNKHGDGMDQMIR